MDIWQRQRVIKLNKSYGWQKIESLSTTQDTDKNSTYINRTDQKKSAAENIVLFWNIPPMEARLRDYLLLSCFHSQLLGKRKVS